MVRWSGDWVGHWQGDWQGEGEAGGVVNAALIVNGGSTARFHAVDLTPPAVVTGGGVGRLLYSSLLQPRLRSVVGAGLVVTAKGRARFAPVAGQSLPATLSAKTKPASRFAPTVGRIAPAALGAQGESTARITALVGRAIPATLAAASQSTARFTATVNTRTVVVPIRPRVELADDEIIAILQLMAA